MSQIIDKLALSFPSTERRKGAAAAEDRAVQVSSSSDTVVNAFVRNSSPARVTLSTSEVTDRLITAKCTCTVAKKSQLCRHIWATLLRLDDQGHDFLLSKESISLADTDDLMVDRSGNEYRKKRSDCKDRAPAFHYPSNVEQARQYFQANGFEMKQPFELSEIVDAKKQLSRVFHPDKGGSHDEILELNRNFQILSDYLKS
jgi:hypothetical protein